MDYLRDRTWMYKQKDGQGFMLRDFFKGVDVFINFASKKSGNQEIRCPCKKCKNEALRDGDTIKCHLCRYGFVPNYELWTYQGELTSITCINDNENNTFDHGGNHIQENRMEAMVYDAAGPLLHNNLEKDSNVEEPPNAEAKKFFDLLQAANRPLWNGCETHTELSATARYIAIKAKYNSSESEFSEYLKASKEMLPSDNVLGDSYYKMKKLVSAFGLPYQKIDTCRNGCMLFWKNDKELKNCKYCSAERYKGKKNKTKEVPYTRLHYLPLIPRLQRLYASAATASHMRWHINQNYNEGLLCHPSDGEAWKHFDRTYPDFAKEARNVRLGLCTDGFAPFDQFGKQYSSWPVILTPYNLPPWMCMKNPYMFLTLIIPGPRDPKQGIDVYLQPLIDELNHLWNEGVLTYDVSKKNNFIMRASLLWTIGDFPAYGMLSGWSTAGRLACPYCMEWTSSFRLANGGKMTWFDCHRCFLDREHLCRNNRKDFRRNSVVTGGAPPMLSSEEIYDRVKDFPKIYNNPNGLNFTIEGKGFTHNWCKQSIFWELPYWRNLLLRHNIDVMHNEKNIFENVFNTVLNVKGKTKDDLRSRRDIRLYCKRPELELNDDNDSYKPKACYELSRESCKILLKWVENLRLPDGIASNLRRCVDLNSMRMNGMKTHDCHLFLENLFPMAFKELLPHKVWCVITELSLFYKELCTTTLKLERIKKMEKIIPELICKLERIFPPGFFNVMEHLPIHLPFEARMRGPVQYGWMYPFERYIRHLKRKVGNKACVEGSICNAYIMEEAATFFSHYFEDHVKKINRPTLRNDHGIEEFSNDCSLSVFRKEGRPFGCWKKHWLNDEEYNVVRNYVLLNCKEVEPFISIFEGMNPDIPLTLGFSDWFLNYVCDPKNKVMDKRFKFLAFGPQKQVRKCKTFFVNGYKFQTEEYGYGKSTYNSGVCVKGCNDPEMHMQDYYGVLKEIYELTYSTDPEQRVFLFKCHWFDNTPKIGINVHPLYNLIEINHKSKYKTYDPFVLATQAIQVYYATYPSEKSNKNDWWAVCKTKARYMFDTNILDDQAYQADLDQINELTMGEEADFGPLNDANYVTEAYDMDEEEDNIVVDLESGNESTDKEETDVDEE